jgi:hypothetical protein
VYRTRNDGGRFASIIRRIGFRSVAVRCAVHLRRLQRALSVNIGHFPAQTSGNVLISFSGSAQEFDEAQAGVDFMRGGIFGKLAVCETPI